MRATKTRSPLRRTVTALVLVPSVMLAVSCGTDDGGSQQDRNAPSASTLHVNTGTDYYRDLTRMRYTETDSADEIEALQSVPVPLWLSGDWELTDDRIMSTLEQSLESGETPMFVLYNIPDRDLGYHSSGGAYDDSEYLEWVSLVSGDIGDSPAVLILEPDALGHIPEMDDDEAQLRLETIAASLDILSANENAAVYLDAGNASWLDASTTADLIARIDGIADTETPGIALNVSNYISEEESLRYAESIENDLGRDLYVIIDNSRNGGDVEDGEWCNPPGQLLGDVGNTFDPDEKVMTAYIKVPGQSDGECGISDAEAGEFDDELLLEQLGQ